MMHPSESMFPSESISRSNLAVEINEPFFIFEIKNLFQEETFRELDRQYPDQNILPKAHSKLGKKKFMSSKMPAFFEFLKQAPAWTTLYQHFCKPEVIKAFYKLTENVDSERPKSESKEWRLVTDPARSGQIGFLEKTFMRLMGRIKGYTPVRAVFEISYLEDSYYIPPHTDIAPKLLSLMIYFPDQGAEYAECAGTEFYRGRDRKPAWNGWGSGMLPDDEAAKFYREHETFYMSNFEPNKVVGFVKSSTSWHGIEKLDLPPGVARRSLNINYFTI